MSTFQEPLFGEVTETHAPPVTMNPVDDRERRRRHELRALDEHDARVFHAQQQELAGAGGMTSGVSG